MGAPEHPLGPLAPLAAYPQWVVAVLAPKANGKIDKLPFQPSGAPASVNDSATWTDYETAARTAAAEPWAAGIGFVLTDGDPFTVIDVDNALQPDGESWSPLALDIVNTMPGAVVEVSQSGRGLHVWAHRAAMPEHACKNVPLAIECYSSGRFILLGSNAVGAMADDCPGVVDVVTRYFPPRTAAAAAAPLADGPRPEWRGPADDTELLRRALQSRSAGSVFGARASFADLYERNVEALARAYPPDSSSTEPYDASSADAALFAHLAFWSGCHRGRMERIARRSALVRGKWDARSDYIERTIANACSLQREVLQDKEPPAAPVPVAAGAPAMRAAEGERFLSAAAQAEMFKGCVYVADVHRALVPGGDLLKPEQFRAKFGGYTFAMDNRNERTTRNAWEAFTESQVLVAPRVDGTCFRPPLPYGEILRSEGRSRVNMFWPVEVERKAGSIEPFDRHLRLLLPNDWPILLYYMAGIVQFLGVKFQWMPLLIGVEGNGKTFFSRCVARAVGKRYTHWPKAKELDNKFNGWLPGKVFYAIEDLKISGDVWESLKPMITGEDIEIEGKGVDQRSDEICGNFIANSNHFDAIRATRNDRRVAHLHCAQQTVDDLARDGINERYTSTLYEWAEGGGYAIVAEYLHTLPVPAEYGRAWLTGRAPKTTSTVAAIEHGRSPVEQAILDAIEEERPGFRGGWISSTMAETLIEGKRLLGQYPRAARDGVLRGLGYRRHPALGEKGHATHPVAPDGRKAKLYIKDGHPSLELQRQCEVERAYSAAQTAA